VELITSALKNPNTCTRKRVELTKRATLIEGLAGTLEATSENGRAMKGFRSAATQNRATMSVGGDGEGDVEGDVEGDGEGDGEGGHIVTASGLLGDPRDLRGCRGF
jgi:hypothetical protein